MNKFLLNILVFFARFLLSMRYTIKITGLSKIQHKNGVLILPNHPAEIDPSIISIILWREFKLRPVVLEDFYYMPVLNTLFRMLRTLPMPDMEKGRSQFKLRRINSVINEITNGLERGDNFLLYPSGRLSRDGSEMIGGASAINSFLQNSPDANLILARTKGLWGSSFSCVYRNKRPYLFKQMISGEGVLLLNLLFFTPRRKINIDLC